MAAVGWGPRRAYQCSLGDRTLRNGHRSYFDLQGHKLGQFGKARTIGLFQRATYFREGNFGWTNPL
jgi:hypothetical protein